MILTDFFSPKDVILDMRASGKTQVLAELSRHAAHSVGVAPDLILGALTRREELGSTGMGEGIALPHARMPDITAPLGVLARLKAPIPFDAVDGKPVDLVFMLLLPTGAAGAQLNALACAARGLRDAAVVAALRGARTKDGLHAAFISRTGNPTQDGA